jgi:hypothetical protein
MRPSAETRMRLRPRARPRAGFDRDRDRNPLAGFDRESAGSGGMQASRPGRSGDCVLLGSRFRAADVSVCRRGRSATRSTHADPYSRPACGAWWWWGSCGDTRPSVERLVQGSGGRLRQRPQTFPVGCAVDLNRRCRWRSRPTAHPLAGVADRAPPRAPPRPSAASRRRGGGRPGLRATWSRCGGCRRPRAGPRARSRAAFAR